MSSSSNTPFNSALITNGATVGEVLLSQIDAGRELITKK